mmetsp:Transcript_50347/g.106998  ORF Transcript_50347/g.106998 Transcript_50347/m.106998 type:complete len:269 (-) Transcript_50347:149-955(-)
MDEIDVDWGSEEPEEEADDDDDEFCNALGLEQVSLGLASTSVSSSQIASSRSSAPSPTPTPPGFLPHHAPAGRYKVILCQFSLLGHCRRGPQCHYAHSDQEQNAWQAYWSQVEQAGCVPTPAPVHRKGSGWQLGQSRFLRLSPAEINFTQNDISPMFRRGLTILDLFKQLNGEQGQQCLRKIPLMQVVLFDDRYYSLDNRRLCLYRLCQQTGLLEDTVKVRFYEQIPQSFHSKFTTQCHGERVTIRGRNEVCGRCWEETTFGKSLFGG